MLRHSLYQGPCAIFFVVDVALRFIAKLSRKRYSSTKQVIWDLAILFYPNQKVTVWFLSMPEIKIIGENWTFFYVLTHAQPREL